MLKKEIKNSIILDLEKAWENPNEANYWLEKLPMVEEYDEAVYKYLKQFTYHEKTRFFIVEDEYCDNPQIRVMEQYEVDSGKRFTFKYDGSRWFWTGEDERYYDTIQLSTKIYNLILKDY